MSRLICASVIFVSIPLACLTSAFAWSDKDCVNACKRAPGGHTVAQCIQYNNCAGKAGQPTEGAKAVNAKVKAYNARRGQ
jgi:hypothetical protein